MKRPFFGVLLLCGALFLSGCTTEEVKKDASKPGEDLDFTLDDKAPAKAPAPKAPAKTPPVPAPAPKPVSNKTMYDQAPAMSIDAAKTYTATLKTSAGDIEVELFASKTPKTVNNFVFLANEKFYDNTIFHRTISGFMIQGGDPEGTGRGGPGYRFDDEAFEGEYTRGTLAMANAGPDTNGSQFFIMHKDYALPPSYVIFGKVTKGIEVVDKIATAPTNGETPVTPVTVKTIEVISK